MERIAKFEKVSKNEETKDFYDYIMLPKRATSGSAGYDFYLPFDLTIKTTESVKVFTGIRAKIDPDYVLMIFPRSGLGTKYHLMLDNTVGVIDSDYRGEVMVALHNHSSEEQIVFHGERIAQLVIMPFYKAIFVETDELSDTVRGSGGFGSTGSK